MLTRYLTVLLANSLPGDRELVNQGSCERAKHNPTAVIVQERTVYTIIEPNLGVDPRKSRTHVVPRRTVLHYHLGLWKKTNH